MTARRRKRFAILVAPLVLGGILLVAADEYVEGLAFLVHAAGYRGAAGTAASWTLESVTEAETTVPWRGGTLRGRIYTANDIDGPATLLVPGVHAEGVDEPRLVKFARDIASTGRIVVTVELPDLKQYSITTRSTDMIEDAALWLATQSGHAPDGRVGMMGISFAGGLSIVAAGRPSLRDRVAFVLSFGGHGDLPRTLHYLCTGVEPDGAQRRPHDYGIAIILLGVADRVVPADQVGPLRDAIRAFLQASHVDMWDKARAELEFGRARAMAETLAEPARTLMGYVNARDVAKLGPILLPHLGDLSGDPALSPAKAPLPSAPVYLLHGADDNVIPAAESRLLEDALVHQGARVRRLSTPLITHAAVDRSAAVRGVWDLVLFWADLLDE